MYQILDGLFRILSFSFYEIHGIYIYHQSSWVSLTSAEYMQINFTMVFV